MCWVEFWVIKLVSFRKFLFRYPLAIQSLKESAFILYSTMWEYWKLGSFKNMIEYEYSRKITHCIERCGKFLSWLIEELKRKEFRRVSLPVLWGYKRKCTSNAQIYIPISIGLLAWLSPPHLRGLAWGAPTSLYIYIYISRGAMAYWQDSPLPT